MLFDAVNFHLWKPCNYKCTFCFATFDDVPGRLTSTDARRVVDEVAPYTDKITFVGGEPTLCPFLGDLVDGAHAAGLATCIVSNGERLREQHAVGVQTHRCPLLARRRTGRNQCQSA